MSKPNVQTQRRYPPELRQRAVGGQKSIRIRATRLKRDEVGRVRQPETDQLLPSYTCAASTTRLPSASDRAEEN
jgi:hypothetical protein